MIAFRSKLLDYKCSHKKVQIALKHEYTTEPDSFYNAFEEKID